MVGERGQKKRGGEREGGGVANRVGVWFYFAVPAAAWMGSSPKSLMSSVGDALVACRWEECEAAAAATEVGVTLPRLPLDDSTSGVVEGALSARGTPPLPSDDDDDDDCQNWRTGEGGLAEEALLSTALAELGSLLVPAASAPVLWLPLRKLLCTETSGEGACCSSCPSTRSAKRMGRFLSRGTALTTAPAGKVGSLSSHAVSSHSMPQALLRGCVSSASRAAAAAIDADSARTCTGLTSENVSSSSSVSSRGAMNLCLVESSGSAVSLPPPLPPLPLPPSSTPLKLDSSSATRPLRITVSCGEDRTTTVWKCEDSEGEVEEEGVEGTEEEAAAALDTAAREGDGATDAPSELAATGEGHWASSPAATMPERGTYQSAA